MNLIETTNDWLVIANVRETKTERKVNSMRMILDQRLLSGEAWASKRSRRKQSHLAETAFPDRSRASTGSSEGSAAINAPNGSARPESVAFQTGSTEGSSHHVTSPFLIYLDSTDPSQTSQNYRALESRR